MKILKYLLLVITTLMFIQSASCQVYKYRKPQKPAYSIGIKGGILWNDMKYTALSEADNTIINTPLFGLTSEWYPRKNISISYELLYSSRSANKNFYTDYQMSYTTFGTSHIEYLLKANGLNFRTPISYYFGTVSRKPIVFRPYVFASPEMYCALNGYMNWRWIHLNNNEIIDEYKIELSKSNFKSLNYGLLLGTGLWIRCTILDHYFVSKLEIAYNIGLSNSFSSEEINNNVEIVYGWGNLEHETLGSRYNQSLEITLAIMLSIKKPPMSACVKWGKY